MWACHVVMYFSFTDGKVKEYPVIPIAAEDIVDTNGAGDAFVGGRSNLGVVFFVVLFGVVYFRVV